MSKIFDALRKAEREPSPLTAESSPLNRTAADAPAQHPRRLRTFEREFGALSSAIQSYFPKSKNGKVILVVGCVEGEGATYVSCNLSRTLARTSGTPILYLDANYHDPCLRRNFMVSDDLGLADVHGQGSVRNLSQVIKAGDVNQLYLLGTGRARISPVAYFNSPEFENTMASLRRTFRFSLVDGPPLLKHPDAIHLASQVDGVVMVVRHKHLTREVIRKGIDMIESVNVPILGAVLNRRKFAIPTLIYKLIS